MLHGRTVGFIALIVCFKACEAEAGEVDAQSWCQEMSHTPGKHTRATPHQAGTAAAGCVPAWLAYSEDNKAQMR